MFGAEIRETFPRGLRVLLVDADPISLFEVERLLLACHYQVTKCQLASDALSLLREKEDSFDIVMSEIHLPIGMNGFQLLQTIGLEMDLPVVMMSSDGRKDIVMKLIIKGACDYLPKPVRMEEIKVIWQHVVRKKRNNFKPYTVSKFLYRQNHEICQTFEINHKDRALKEKKESNQSSNHEKDEESEGHKRIITSLKRPRMVWTSELHDQFVAVVNHIGLNDAVPKKILEVMKVPNLTRENVASHLQKYRLHLQRKNTNTNTQHKVKVSSPVYAISKQFESHCSILFSEMKADKMSIMASGTPMDQKLSLESIHEVEQKSRCYDTTMINHGPYPDNETPTEISNSEQDNFIVMQRLPPQSSFRIEMTNKLVRDEDFQNPDGVVDGVAAYISVSNLSTRTSLDDKIEFENTQHSSSYVVNIRDSEYGIYS